MKTKKQLEAIVELASQHPLRKKPSEIFGKQAQEFIEMFVNRSEFRAFRDGIDLNDKQLIQAALEHFVKKDSRPLDILAEAYQYLEANPNMGGENGEISYEIKQMFLETNPQKAYALAMKDASRGVDEEDKHPRGRQASIDLFLQEAREYFAAKDPFNAYLVGSRAPYPNGDGALVGMAKPNMVLQAMQKNYLFCNLADMLDGGGDSELGLLTAKAALSILEEDWKQESRQEKRPENERVHRLREEEKQNIARAAYHGAQRTRNMGLQRTAREYYVKDALSSATRSVLNGREDDEKLGRIVAEKLLGQKELEFTRGFDSDGDLAYQICEKYGFSDLGDKARQRFVEYSAGHALECGLEYDDKRLVKLASKKLGKRISAEEIALFQPETKEGDD